MRIIAGEREQAVQAFLSYRQIASCPAQSLHEGGGLGHIGIEFAV